MRQAGILLCVLGAALGLAPAAQAQFSQQGGKLVGSGYSGTNVYQGFSVGVSNDGNTAIVGAPGDSQSLGAAWIFTRSSGIWNPGIKLFGSGQLGTAIYQGASVAMSG